MPHSSSEQNENAAWRAMPIAIVWEAGENFALPLVPRQVGVRLLGWNQHAQWISPLLPPYKGLSNFAADK